jgi:putative oxidoreductase
MKNILFHSGKHKPWPSIALLVQRVAFGSMMATHGWSKLINFAERADSFSDPLKIGSAYSLGLVVFAEFFCAILVVFGLATRFAAIPVVITMAMAAFYIHAGDPVGERELSLLYMAAFLVLVILGAGNVSLDKAISGK